MSVSPFQVFQNWLFDGNTKSEIPEEIINSNSPISAQYSISIFMGNPVLNLFFNQYFNNINLWYLDKEELFVFIKKCVRDFRIQRRTLLYVPWKKQDKLYNALRKRVPYLKAYEIVELCKIVDKADNKDQIYKTMGLDDDLLKKKIGKAPKPKKEKVEKKTIKKIKIKEYIESNFRTEEKYE